MLNKKTIILLVSLVGFIVIGLTTAIMLDSPSEPIVFENDNSETSNTSASYDEDVDSEDADFGDESDDFAASMDYVALEAYYMDVANAVEYKDTFDLKFDLLDVEIDLNEKFPKGHYRIKDIIIDKNEKTDSGYNANLRVDFKGYETILRQEVTLSYDLDEELNVWEYKGYNLVGPEKIYPETGGIEYVQAEMEKIPSTKEGTFVYEAVYRDMDGKGQYRKLYVYFIAPRGVMEYEMSAACITLFNDRVRSVDYINNKVGDTSLRPKEIVSYDMSGNCLVRESDESPVFTYNENGGMSDRKPYMRISDEVLSPEEIASKLFYS